MKNFFLTLSVLAALVPTSSFANYNIRDYDAITNLRSRIADGSVFPQVRQQYLSIDGTFYQLGYDGNVRVLNTKYAPTYDCSVKYDPLTCPHPLKQHGSL